MDHDFSSLVKRKVKEWLKIWLADFFKIAADSEIHGLEIYLKIQKSRSSYDIAVAQLTIIRSPNLR